MTDDEIRAWAAVETRRRTVEERPASEAHGALPAERTAFLKRLARPAGA